MFSVQANYCNKGFLLDQSNADDRCAAQTCPAKSAPSGDHDCACIPGTHGSIQWQSGNGYVELEACTDCQAIANGIVFIRLHSLAFPVFQNFLFGLPVFQNFLSEEKYPPHLFLPSSSPPASSPHRFLPSTHTLTTYTPTPHAAADPNAALTCTDGTKSFAADPITFACAEGYVYVQSSEFGDSCPGVCL